MDREHREPSTLMKLKRTITTFQESHHAHLVNGTLKISYRYRDFTDFLAMRAQSRYSQFPCKEATT